MSFRHVGGTRQDSTNRPVGTGSDGQPRPRITRQQPDQSLSTALYNSLRNFFGENVTQAFTNKIKNLDKNKPYFNMHAIKVCSDCLEKQFNPDRIQNFNSEQTLIFNIMQVYGKGLPSTPDHYDMIQKCNFHKLLYDDKALAFIFGLASDANASNTLIDKTRDLYTYIQNGKMREDIEAAKQYLRSDNHGDQWLRQMVDGIINIHSAQVSYQLGKDPDNVNLQRARSFEIIAKETPFKTTNNRPISAIVSLQALVHILEKHGKDMNITKNASDKIGSILHDILKNPQTKILLSKNEKGKCAVIFQGKREPNDDKEIRIVCSADRDHNLIVSTIYPDDQNSRPRKGEKSIGEVESRREFSEAFLKSIQ